MAKKLIEACKELNIGMATAVTFCAKHGKEIVTINFLRVLMKNTIPAMTIPAPIIMTIIAIASMR